LSVSADDESGERNGMERNVQRSRTFSDGTYTVQAFQMAKLLTCFIFVLFYLISDRMGTIHGRRG
jgi:hypothetical protein